MGEIRKLEWRERVSMDKTELFSPEWVDMTRSFLEERVAQLPAEAAGVEYRFCASLTTPPAHLDDGTGKIAHWIIIQVPNVEVAMGERDDCGPVIRNDYQAVLPHAREHMDFSDPEFIARREAERQAKADAGEAISVPPPPELTGLLVDLHNYMADRTA
jgi:hypothetical protein